MQLYKTYKLYASFNSALISSLLRTQASSTEQLGMRSEPLEMVSEDPHQPGNL